MNRYTADGLLRDMRKGRRIIAVYDTLRDAREALEKTTSRTWLRDVRVRRANGMEKIEDLTTGGFIRFLSVRSQGGRGLNADILYIDTELSDDELDSLIPSLNTSPYAEVLRP